MSLDEDPYTVSSPEDVLSYLDTNEIELSL